MAPIWVQTLSALLMPMIAIAVCVIAYFQWRTNQNRLKHDKQCLLVITGADEIGNKDIVGLSDGYRESEQSWFELLLDLKRSGPQPLFLDAFLYLAAQAVEALVKRLAIADEVGDHEARAGVLVRFISNNRFKDKRSPPVRFS